MEHDGLVIYMANKYFPLCDAATDFDDLVQAGRIGVMRAMATYEPGKGAFRRDRVMNELAGLDRRTNWHMHKGLKAWKSDWTSSTEALAFWRLSKQ